MKLFTRGDIDGFFAIALDNLVQLLLLATLCRKVAGFSPELVYGRILPGVAISFLVGNLFYA
jgi:adenine/guanine/hypoxanthine permease